MVVACFVFAGLNGYQIMQGEYSWLDVLLLFVFLLFGAIYLYILLKKEKGK